jgi:hypothetical protein
MGNLLLLFCLFILKSEIRIVHAPISVVRLEGETSGVPSDFLQRRQGWGLVLAIVALVRTDFVREMSLI